VDVLNDRRVYFKCCDGTKSQVTRTVKWLAAGRATGSISARGRDFCLCYHAQTCSSVHPTFHTTIFRDSLFRGIAVGTWRRSLTSIYCRVKNVSKIYFQRPYFCLTPCLKENFIFESPWIAQAYSQSLRAQRSGDRIPVGARYSAAVQIGPGGPPSLLYNEYGVLPRCKAAGAWRWLLTPI
jgi:hypothetical protein